MKNQQKYITSIVLLVIAISGIAGWVESILGKNVASLIASISSISLVIYLLHLAWEKWLWKQKWFSSLLSKIVGFYEYPVLEGRWQLNYESTYSGGTKGTGMATIQQNYSTLFIEGNFGEDSDFDTFFAQLKQKENGKWFLVYAYRNKPKSKKLTSSKSGGMHEGFTYLDIISIKKMEGYYSNDENRKTRGKLIFTKARA